MADAGSRHILLDGRDCDVWAWRKRIAGTCLCPLKPAAIAVRVNDAEIEVSTQGNRVSAIVPLREGRNRIVVSCPHADRGECPPTEITLRQRLTGRPVARIRVSLDDEGIVLDGSGSAASEATGAPIVRYRWKARRGNPGRLSRRSSGNVHSDKARRLIPPSANGEYYVSLKVTDADRRCDEAAACFVVEGGKPRLPSLETDSPAWVESAIIYGVVPHNFGPDGFRSVVAKLDYLRDLGVTALWLSPCTDTKTGGHGYGVSDYFRLRRSYGTRRDFRNLVKEAHARGIRVLMDFVPNHSSVHHPYMKHVLKHGRASPYYSFYEWQEDGEHHAHYFHWKHLPNLNYDHPEARRWMLEAFSYWVREFDVDGFRVDVAWGVRLRRPDFWPEWRRELKRIKPDLLLLAEASARDPYYFTQGFDAAYDWTNELGHWSMEDVFEAPDEIAARLHRALTNEGRGFHEDALIFRFLNNNDTGLRFITRHGLALEKAAAAMLLSLPGLPCIYTGQEVGAEFEPYRTPGPICWDDRHGLRDYYKHLIALRRRFPSLRSRKWEIVKARSNQQAYAYVRYAGDRDQPVLVVLNFSPEQANVEVEIPERFASLATAGQLRDLLTEELVEAEPAGGNAIALRLPGPGARILVGLAPGISR